MILRLIPPIKIHCWGGLGSQLYALALAIDLKHRFYTRKIEFVQHTSGVTKRNLEIDTSRFSSIVIKTIDDFSNDSTSLIAKTSFRKILSTILKNCLVFLGFLSSANNNLEFNSIRAWVLTIRGHYSYRTLNIDFYRILVDYFDLTSAKNKISENPIIGVHYRLGDLLSLSEKAPITVNEVIDSIMRARSKYIDAQVLVFSDSPDKAKDLLIPNLKDSFIQFIDRSTLSVINECVNADYFIGTNSKISIWIFNLRCHLGHGKNSEIYGFDQPHLSIRLLKESSQ